MLCVKRKGKTMIKTVTILVFLSLGVAFNSYADDSDRIDRLEKEVQELKLRISKIESLISDYSKSKELAPSHEGWKSVSNWRELTTDMSEGDVRKILGEPYRVEGGVIATWYYRNDGEVGFYQGKVDSWTEPRQ